MYLEVVMRMFVLAFMVFLAKPPVALEVSPSISTEPAHVRMKVTIEKDETNRIACAGYDGPQFRRSCWALDGADAPRTTWVEFRDVPAGRYAAFVDVGTNTGREAHAVSRLCVLSKRGEDVGCVEDRTGMGSVEDGE